MREADFSERLDYALRQLEEIMSVKANIRPLDEKIRNAERTLDELKTRSISPAVAYSGFRPVFDLQDSRRRTLEDVILMLSEFRKQVQKDLSRDRLKTLSSSIDGLVEGSVRLNGMKIVSAQISAESIDELKSLGDTLRARLGSGVGVLASVIDEKVSLVCVVTDDLISTKRLEAGKIVGAVARLLGGGGGGKAHLATAGGKDVSNLNNALQKTESIVRSFLA